MDEFTLLETKIESLKKEIEDNPDYSQNIKESILDDIAYYQNHLNHLNDTL
jgi:predicted RNA-binding protein with EMAP domain